MSPGLPCHHLRLPQLHLASNHHGKWWKVVTPTAPPWESKNGPLWPPTSRAANLSDGELLAQLVIRFGSMPVSCGGGTFQRPHQEGSHTLAP